MVRVHRPDMEMFLTRYLRERAAARGDQVSVGNKEPASFTSGGKPLIVVRDDGGPRRDWTTFDTSVGVSVLAGTRLNDKPANDLAFDVFADLTDEAILTWPGSPVASIEWDGCNSPTAVAEAADVARRYMTASFVLIGTW